MNILLIYPGFILAFIIVFCYECKIRRTEPMNKVHFYVARDKTHNLLWLYLGKPIRYKDDAWLPGKHGTVINTESSFEMIGLNKKDYDSLKWEDEPIEVFLNLEN